MENVVKRREKYRDKLNFSYHLDVIYIGSIVATHYDIALMALNAGKHVLCEKPLSINEKQCKRIVKTAQEKNLFFMEGIWSRFFESYKFLRRRIDDGDLGEIKEINLEFGFPLANTQRLFLKNGGGSILDLAPYPIQIALWAFNAEPTKTIAFGKLNEDGLDVELTGEFHFLNGGIVKFKISCLNALSNECCIKGSKGEILVSLLFMLHLSCAEAFNWPLFFFLILFYFTFFFLLLLISGHKFMSLLRTEISFPLSCPVPTSKKLSSVKRGKKSFIFS